MILQFPFKQPQEYGFCAGLSNLDGHPSQYGVLPGGNPTWTWGLPETLTGTMVFAVARQASFLSWHADKCPRIYTLVSRIREDASVVRTSARKCDIPMRRQQRQGERHGRFKVMERGSERDSHRMREEEQQSTGDLAPAVGLKSCKLTDGWI
ncbi:hypothetical protein LY78DRAFT_157361 [Colletotrichum sublineola]|nr:hypothetical protein LY78DRAFT_157361 [Colletotrichum sublineola]